MGCSRFGERWDASAEDLMVEAYHEALADAQIAPAQIDAAWLSTHLDDVGVGRGGTPMGTPLRLAFIGPPRVQHFCAAGSGALRAPGSAVAPGARAFAPPLRVDNAKDTDQAHMPPPALGPLL